MTHFQLAQQELDEMMEIYKEANPDGGVYDEVDLIRQNIAHKFGLSLSEEKRLVF